MLFFSLLSPLLLNAHFHRHLRWSFTLPGIAVGPDEQPLIAHQEGSTEATSVAEVASVRGQAGSRKKMVAEGVRRKTCSRKKVVTGAQLAERRRISEAAAAAASQDSNDKPAEIEVSERDEDEGDPTDVEADFEETTAMAMRDRVVQRQRLFAWT